jgi:hypothetical protein
VSLPADVANQALDSIGSETVIGDLTEGTREAQVLLRWYGQTLRQLLRAANWNFARAEAPLLLLADASGNTPNVGTLVPTGWIYEYALPVDCMKVRFIPWQPNGPNSSPPSGNIQIPSTLIVANLAASPAGMKIRPARFQIASDSNYPVPIGSSYDVQGISPQARTVILCNVPNALCVYTAMRNYPANWDSLFRQAFVAALASQIAFPLNKDKKLGMAVRTQQIQILKQTLIEARLADGNDGVSRADLSVDWMSTRFTGGSWGTGHGSAHGGGYDGGWGGYDSIMLADGSTF